MDFAAVVEEGEDARLVLMGPHAAFQHLADVLVGVVLIPIVHYSFGGVGFVLQVEPDEAGQLVEVVDNRGLAAGDDFLIVFVGALHLVEELHLVFGEGHIFAVEEFGEACRPEGRNPFVDSLLMAGDSDLVEFLEGDALLVDQHGHIVAHLQADAVVVEVHQGGDAVAAAGGDHMDGGGCHAEDGLHLIEDDGVFGDEAFLAEADLMTLL